MCICVVELDSVASVKLILQPVTSITSLCT